MPKRSSPIAPRAYAMSFELPSKTKQEFKASSDMTNILRRHAVAGVRLAPVPFDSVDLTTAVDYQTALNTIIEADSQFASLPSDVRKRFNNSPVEFLSFVNSASRDDLGQLGLLKDWDADDYRVRMEADYHAKRASTAPQHAGVEAPKA